MPLFMQQNKNALLVIVTGDVTMDWNIARHAHPSQEATEWTGEARSNLNWQYGSAALLAELITTMTKQLESDLPYTVKVISPDTPAQASFTLFNTCYVHSYAVWAQYRDKVPEKTERSEPHWRVERFLGLDLPSEGVAEHRGNPVPKRSANADIIVIDDSNLGFRNNKANWPEAISEPAHNVNAPWIIVKMSSPVAKGDLWSHLVAKVSDRLVAVLTIDDLRQSKIQVSARISWEKTAQELNWELTHNPEVNGLTNAAYCIVSFGTTGALLIPGRHNSGKKPTLLFDPLFMEGEWAPGKGMMIGKTSTLVASIVFQILLNRDAPDFKQGVQCGVTAMRHLQTVGDDGGTEPVTRLQFPTEGVISTLKNAEIPLAEAELQASTVKNSSQRLHWTILAASSHDSLESLSETIVLQGTKNTLKNVPIGKFGKLVTVDRQEIESLRSIQSLIGEYCTQKKERPLSIAVFGPPGSGKSFAVEQIALVANPEKIAEKTLTFNLSQFNDPDELINAFHQIRDIGLSGKIPLVFWDEFDSTLENKKLGWLRFFLAPMQDGKFQEGQITHPIGKAIYVFAGGTFPNVDSFMNLLSEEDLTQDLANKLANKKASPLDKKTIEEAKKIAKKLIKKISDAKVPDFISRLKGFLNVLGPNPQEDNKQNDPFYIVRRALLLRSIFERETPQLLDKDHQLRIDTGILRGFLQINKYLHGARSMESIVAMSRLGNRSHFSRSNLPPEKQLRLHVDPVKFIELLHKLKLEGDLLETLAKLNHLLFCKNLRKEKYVLGKITDEKTEPKTHSSLKPYACLPAHEKEQNRRAVRDIPNKLERFGYAMAPGRNNEADIVFPTDILEKMAELEHERWVKANMDENWEHAFITDKDNKLHTLLVKWDELSKDEKDKDRRLISESIPYMLRKAGYTIVKLSV
jgi:hypothetical protein